MEMVDAPNVRGYFWSPAMPNHQVAGHLQLGSDGGMELELFGTISGEPIDTGDDIPRILGLTSKGARLTLEHCSHISQSTSFPGFALTTYSAGVVLVGCHLDVDEVMEFDKIAYQSDILDAWYHFGGIQVENFAKPAKVIATYLPIPKRTWAIDADSSVSLYTTASTKGWGKVHEASISQKTWTCLEFKAALPLDELIDVSRRVLNFARFVLDQPVPMTAVTVSRTYKGEEPLSYPNIAVYFGSGDAARVNVSEAIKPFPFFGFDRIEKNYGEVLGGWLSKYNILNGPFNLYFATKGRFELYQENRFLMLAQALEALHRHSSKSKPIPIEEYKQLCASLKAVVPEKFQYWLKPKLDFGNEPSLSERLTALFDSVGDVFGEEFDKVLCAKNIKDTRNYLTHYSSALKKKAAVGRAQYRLCLIMECVFQVNLARLSGFDMPEVIAFCQGSQRFLKKLESIKLNA